ncbi:MAG TPA: tellurite resistance TerB family protein, partial [Myxococcales bacterium]|nr:tellurite resistance TerB family protein [Myxococcales bacterium]
MTDDKQARKVVQLMVLAAWADGHVVGSEAIAIQKLISAAPLLSGVGPIAELSREARARLTEEGMEECLLSAASGIRDREYKELAFQCCARVIGADSVLAVEEEEFLKKLQQLFALGTDD